jgi:hypothetical protein
MIRALVALLLLSGCTATLHRVQRTFAGSAEASGGSTSARTIRDCETPFARVAMSDEQESWVVFLPAADLPTLRRDRVVQVARERPGACFERTENPSQGDPGDWRPAR